MAASKRRLSPFPHGSKVVLDRQPYLTNDWLKWFTGLMSYLTAILGFYDSTIGGTTALVAGTKTVSITKVTASSLFRLTPQTASANAGHLSVSVVAGVSFTILSSNALDTRTIFYEMLEAL